MTKNIKRKTLKLKNNNNVIKIKIVKRDFWPEQKNTLLTIYVRGILLKITQVKRKNFLYNVTLLRVIFKLNVMETKIYVNENYIKILLR